jgi:hypothetical protein
MLFAFKKIYIDDKSFVDYEKKTILLPLQIKSTTLGSFYILTWFIVNINI